MERTNKCVVKQCTGLMVELFSDGMSEWQESIKDVDCKDLIEVRVILDGEEKCFTYSEFLALLGF